MNRSELRKIMTFRQGTPPTMQDNHLSGWASVTGEPYEVNDWLGSYTETVAPGAFARTLANNADVRLLINHDGIPLARTASGTLQLRELTDATQDPDGIGKTGLRVDANLDAASPLVQELTSAMQRGDLDQMSFAFQVVNDEWNEDMTQRIIREVQLFDVSCVTFPANPATSVSLNSMDLMDDQIIQRMRRGFNPQQIARVTAALTALRDDPKPSPTTDPTVVSQRQALRAARLKLMRSEAQNQ